MEAAVSLRDLHKRFGVVRALDGVTFDVPRGSLFGLLGPNGAGKTTLFSLCAGFLRPTAGTAEVLGIDVSRISALRGRFSMFPQDARFQAGIPVIDQLVMFARLMGHDPAAAQRAAQAALELVGLGEAGAQSARALSHGMLKRVMLCQAFLGDPEVIFLDEPTAGLDPDNARRMRELILQARGVRTVVISSHNLAEIQAMCDHVAILHEGRLVQVGPMEILTGATHLLRVVLSRPLTDEDAAVLRAIPAVQAVEATGGREVNVRLRFESPEERDPAVAAILRALLDRGVVPRAFHEGASLETRFLEVTGGTYDGASST